MSAAYASGSLVPGGVTVNGPLAGSINLNLGFGGQPIAQLSLGGYPGNVFPANTITVTASTNGGASYSNILVLDAIQNLYFNSQVNIAQNDVRFFYINTLGVTNVNVTSTLNSGAMPVSMASIANPAVMQNVNEAMMVSLLTMLVKGSGILAGEDLTTL